MTAWEDIVPHPLAEWLPSMSIANRCQRNQIQDKLRDQQRASHWRNKHSSTATVQINLHQFHSGSEAHTQALIPMISQIRAGAAQSGLETHPNLADTICFTKAAETIYEAQTQEEAMVWDLLEQWRKGGHGHVPDVKGGDIICLGCKNVNSLSLFDPRLTKHRKLLNLHNKYQMDGACIVEHGINFCMTPEGSRLDNIFAAFCSSCVSVAHNTHEQHSRYHQGRTLTAAFTHLSGFVKSTGVDPTGLGCWSWIQVGSGEYRTSIVIAYQPSWGSNTP